MRIALSTAVAFLCLSAPAGAEQQEDVRASSSCRYCGMDREKFAHSRMLVEYEDGAKVGLCSLHCAGVELAVQIDRSPVAIRVADHATRELVDAEKAVWVIGGTAPGVMTARAKWAFRDRTGAEAFVKANGGVVATFDEAMKAAYEDMYQDTKMIRERRKAKRAKAAAAPAPAEPAPAAHLAPAAHPAPAKPAGAHPPDPRH